MKFYVGSVTVVGIYGLLYAFVSNLSAETSAMIGGGILVLLGGAVVGVFSILLVGVTLRNKPQSRDERQPMQQPPFIMLTGNSAPGGNFQELAPPQQHYLPLPATKDTVTYEEW